MKSIFEKRRLVLLVVAALFAVANIHAGEILCEAGGFAGHLQGIAADATGIYWSYYDTILKTDYAGKTLATVKIPRHSGDLCAANGKVYVSVCYYDAKMVADVDLGDDQTVLGSPVVSTTAYSLGGGSHFKGVFDGQGHTLTVAYTPTDNYSASPFSSIEGATIKNLHIAGTIVSPTYDHMIPR